MGVILADPPTGYRYLQNGEVIQKGDLFRTPSGRGGWYKHEDCFGDVYNRGGNWPYHCLTIRPLPSVRPDLLWE